MKRQLGIGALIVLIMAALVLTGCDTAANSGSDGGNASGSSTVLDGKEYATESGAHTLTFKDGKAISSGWLIPSTCSYKVNETTLTLSGDSAGTTWTYICSIDEDYTSIKVTEMEYSVSGQTFTSAPTMTDELKLKTE